MPADAIATRGHVDTVHVVRSLLALCKPRVTRMVVVTSWLGAVIAPGHAAWAPLVVALIGTSFIVAGANAVNMYLEADVDALMQRTRTRPIPSGHISAEVALAFGLSLAVLGYAVLARWGNTTASLLAVAAFLAYAFVYTPAKRHSAYALHIGAVPGAIPPLIGWATATGGLSVASLSLFAILFIWQLPHFMAITLFRSAEYERAGFKVYPTMKGVAATQRAMVHWSVLLAFAMLLPWWAGVAGAGYAAVALGLGLSFLALVVFGRKRFALERYARIVFGASIPYLVVALAALAWGAN